MSRNKVLFPQKVFFLKKIFYVITVFDVCLVPCHGWLRRGPSWATRHQHKEEHQRKGPHFRLFFEKNQNNNDFPSPYPCLLLRETAAPTDNSRKMKVFRAKRKKHNDSQPDRKEGRDQLAVFVGGRRRKFPISSDRKPFPLIFSFDPSLLLRRWVEDLLLRWEKWPWNFLSPVSSVRPRLLYVLHIDSPTRFATLRGGRTTIIFKCAQSKCNNMQTGGRQRFEDIIFRVCFLSTRLPALKWSCPTEHSYLAMVSQTFFGQLNYSYPAAFCGQEGEEELLPRKTGAKNL